MSVPSSLPHSDQPAPLHVPQIPPQETFARGAANRRSTSDRCAGTTNEPVRGCGNEWMSLLYACEKLLLAGLRSQIGPHGDLKCEYRRWYREQMDEHDRLVSASYDRLHAALGE